MQQSLFLFQLLIRSILHEKYFAKIREIALTAADKTGIIK